jgi:hypothetical protein
MSMKPFAALSASILLAACAGAAAPPSAPAGPESVSSASASASLAASAAPDAPAPSAAPVAPKAKRPDPTSVADCKALALDPTAEAPPGDSTSPTVAGGESDRSAPIAEVVRKKRPAFRCCFDIWAGKIPEARLFTKVAFSLVLDPTGKVKSAVAKEEEGGPAVSGEVGGCLSDVAGVLTYPPSASAKDTTYRHHFDFKPRKHN